MLFVRLDTTAELPTFAIDDGSWSDGVYLPHIEACGG
jgi:hypothetical protein